MHASIAQRRALYQALQQRVQIATAEFRSKSRFFVQPGSEGGWAVVSADTNRLYGQHKRYLDAVTYAESLERAMDAKVVAAVTVKVIGERATRWVALLGLLLIVFAGAASS